VVSKSIIVIFIMVFAVLGLLLGFAESIGNSGGASFAKYRVDTDRAEINVTDTAHESLGVWQPAPNPDGS
jgi:hypothetical protein